MYLSMSKKKIYTLDSNHKDMSITHDICHQILIMEVLS